MFFLFFFLIWNCIEKKQINICRECKEKKIKKFVVVVNHLESRTIILLLFFNINKREKTNIYEK